MTDRLGKDDASKASFKLSLIETVKADPAMEPSDLKLVAAMVAVMSWPRREAWLSTSRARAMTGLSERQVSNSRARLAGNNKAKRSYLIAIRKQGTATLYRVENPWAEQMIMHVAEATDYYREQLKDRQAERRRLQRPVPAKSAETDEPLSQSPSDCDVTAMVAGNIPPYTPQNIALKGRTPSQVNGYASASGSEDEGNYTFPIPSNEAEADHVLTEILRGIPATNTVWRYMRQKLMAGTLTRKIVQEHREAFA